MLLNCDCHHVTQTTYEDYIDWTIEFCKLNFEKLSEEKQRDFEMLDLIRYCDY